MMNKNIILIGDVHDGNMNSYLDICERSNQKGFDTIQLGDIGFKKEYDQIKFEGVNGTHNYVLFGNHDYYDKIDDYVHTKDYSLGDFGFNEELSLFWVRGARSIDAEQRIIGYSWFPNEELNTSEQLEAYDLYCKVKPRFVISHDCPHEMTSRIFHKSHNIRTSTGLMLQNMFEFHKPRFWIFGHYHQSKNVNIDGTTFICLNELETLDLRF